MKNIYSSVYWSNLSNTRKTLASFHWLVSSNYFPMLRWRGSQSHDHSSPIASYNSTSRPFAVTYQAPLMTEGAASANRASMYTKLYSPEYLSDPFTSDLVQALRLVCTYEHHGMQR